MKGKRQGKRRLLRPFRIVLGALLVAYLLAVPTGWLGDRLLLGHDGGQVDPGGAIRRVLRVDGKKVECWVARSPGAADREPAAYVVFFVGKSDRADRWTTAVAGQWGKRPVEVWGMNYPGTGGSDGPAHLSAVAPAALGAYDAVREQAGGRPVFVQAASLGTTAALHVARHRPVSGLVLQNPPPMRQLLLGYYGWWNLWLLAGPVSRQVPAELESLDNAGHVTAPAVFIVAGGDDVVPPKYQRRVSAAYAGPKREIENWGAGHSGGLTREAAEKLAEDVDWLWQAAGAGNP